MADSSMLSHLVPSTDFQPASIEQGVLEGSIPCCLLLERDHHWGCGD